MSLTTRDMREIAKLLDASHFARLELTVDGVTLRMRCDGVSGGPAPSPAPLAPPPSTGTAETIPRPASPAPAAASPPPPAGGPAAGEVDVPAPLLGNYYAAPRPGEDPFVKVGDLVNEDTIIAIIEVMKLMNPIRAGVAGTVTAILVKDGTSVEQGQALIRVRTGR